MVGDEEVLSHLQSPDLHMAVASLMFQRMAPTSQSIHLPHSCRKELYVLLTACVTSPSSVEVSHPLHLPRLRWSQPICSPPCPTITHYRLQVPPVQQAMRLLCGGLQDPSLEVGTPIHVAKSTRPKIIRALHSRIEYPRAQLANQPAGSCSALVALLSQVVMYCRQALSACDMLIHPRLPAVPRSRKLRQRIYPAALWRPILWQWCALCLVNLHLLFFQCPLKAAS